MSHTSAAILCDNGCARNATNPINESLFEIYDRRFLDILFSGRAVIYPSVQSTIGFEGFVYLVMGLKKFSIITLDRFNGIKDSEELDDQFKMFRCGEDYLVWKTKKGMKKVRFQTKEEGNDFAYVYLNNVVCDQSKEIIKRRNELKKANCEPKVEQSTFEFKFEGTFTIGKSTKEKPLKPWQELYFQNYKKSRKITHPWRNLSN